MNSTDEIRSIIYLSHVCFESPPLHMQTGAIRLHTHTRGGAKQETCSVTEINTFTPTTYVQL